MFVCIFPIEFMIEARMMFVFRTKSNIIPIDDHPPSNS